MLDEHLPLAIDILSDIVRNPAFSVEDLEREKKVVVEEIKMVEDTPDDLVHELFTQGVLGEPRARPPDSGHARKPSSRSTPILLRDVFHQRLHARGT